MAFQAKAIRYVPWFKRDYTARYQSTCKGKWVLVHYRGKFAFGQWEDVGPFRVDNAEYVFGNAAPNTPTGAGLDVSPAIRDYLVLQGKDDRCDWRFVEPWEVPQGPWLDYGEKAMILSLIRDRKRSGKPLPRGASNFDPTRQ